MRVLQVIHRYPPQYMAGSELYTHNLVKQLSKTNDVGVFTRNENPFEEPYSLQDEVLNNTHIRRVNKPFRDYIFQDKYLDIKIDKAFLDFAEEFNPDIIHIGHLSHLSTNIPKLIKEKLGVPVVFTIHDFWLYCFRGQLLDPKLKICDSPSLSKCLKCAKFFFKDTVSEQDIIKYKDHMRKVVDCVDLFLAPSIFVKTFFELQGVDKDRIIFSKYGFYKDAITYRDKTFEKHSKLKFGFTGRVIPPKGIKILLKAFEKIEDSTANLAIYGDGGEYLARETNSNIQFFGGYENSEIDKILKKIDVLIVPSVWYENSPLVIQEAFLAGVPVITSNQGGMSELVEDGVDGFTFEAGNYLSLRDVIKQIIDDPPILNTINPGRQTVRTIEEDVANLQKIYLELL